MILEEANRGLNDVEHGYEAHDVDREPSDTFPIQDRGVGVLYVHVILWNIVNLAKFVWLFHIGLLRLNISHTMRTVNGL